MSNKHQPMNPNRRMLSGFTMIEVLGALLIVAIMMPTVAWLWQKGATEVRKRSVASHFTNVARATEKYIGQNYATLRAASSDTAGPVISLATGFILLQITAA